MIWLSVNFDRFIAELPFRENSTSDYPAFAGGLPLYQEANSQYQFASLPGVAAFLFYSGLLSVVMLGMVVFTLCLLATERLIFALTKNPFLCALLGLTFANLIAQFGITPRMDIPFVSMTMGAVLGISILQSKFFARILARPASVKAT